MVGVKFHKIKNQEVLKRLIFLFTIIFISNLAIAQKYLDFVENKGQWDESIKYKSEIAGGTIFLKSTGYRVMQYNVDDYHQLSELLHSHNKKDDHSIIESADGSKKKIPMGDVGAELNIRSHSYEVKFLNANSNPTIVPDKALASYNNYILGNDPSKWTSNCKVYNAVTYKNVYPNIDVRFYTSNETLKYDIIVHPGGDPNKVILYFDGVDGLKVKDEVLQIKTSVGTINELAPYSYSLNNNERTEIACGYEVKGNFVQFKLNSDYNKSATLVIDPSVIFISYTGSVPDNWGFTATYDGSGNFYAGGIVFAAGFPLSNGAFQTTFKGGGTLKTDMGIMKFDATGINRVYSTYIGGAGDDQPHSLVVDRAGNLVIAGRSSSSDYPTKGITPLYGTGGGYDIVLTKLNATGTALIGSSRIGGTKDDGVNIAPNYPQSTGSTSTRRNYGDDSRSEVILDNDNNILLASVTQSTDFKVTASAFQTKPGASTSVRFQDGVVIKMDPNLNNVLFSSFLGGNNDDAAFVLSINPLNGDIFVAGATASTDLPGDKSGVISATNQGAAGTVDGFIMNIKSDGSAINKTTYIGTTGQDVLFGIQFDKLGFPYITGTTTGTFPVKNSNFNTKNPSQSTGKQFIAKLTPDLSSYVFFTNFGSPTAVLPSLSITAFLVDRCQNMYVSGWGGSSIGDNYVTGTLDGMIISRDAYKKVTDGADFYFFILGKNADSLIYATYFGQDAGFADHVDGGTSRFDPSGTIYQSICSCGGSRGSNPRTSIVGTPGSWSPNRGNNSCNLLAVKLAFYSAGISSGVKSAINGRSGDSTGCVPLTVNFSDTIANAKTYYWDFDGDGINNLTTTTANANFTFNAIGTYRVRLISEDLNTCNERDTSYITIIVRDDAVTNLNFNYQTVGNCGLRQFQFNNLSIPPLGGTFKLNSFEWDFGDGSPVVRANGSPETHKFPADGSYIVRLTLKDPLFCNEDDYIEQTVRVSATFTPSFTADTACIGSPTNFTYTGLGGASFVWNFGDGSPNSILSDPKNTYARDGRYTVTLTVTDNNTCDATKTKIFTKEVIVSPNPTSLFDYTPRSSQPNQIYTFTNLSTGGNKYQWDFGDSKVIATSKRDTLIRYSFTASGTYDVCLFTTNSVGCINKYCEPITALVNPLFDVPNAFSPNGDGVNEKIYVRGFGVAKMTWRIYNRWGSVVYYGTSINEGWNGYYNGKLQAQDVYHYTVEIEFSDKTKASKKGDITLLR
jgi:gliding motility-associated-like protein